MAKDAMEDALKRWRELPESERQFVLNGLKRVLEVVTTKRGTKAAIDLLTQAGAS